MTEHLKRLSINQATTRVQWSLKEAIDGYLRHEMGGIAVWFDKLRETGVNNGAKLVKDSGLSVSGYCVSGDYSMPEGIAREKMLDDNRRMVDEAAAINAACLVVIGGGVIAENKGLADARMRARDGIAQMLEYARSAGVTLALEPLNPMVCSLRSVLCTLAQANAWCEQLGPGTGVAVDTYNVWWDPELEVQIERAAGRIVAFHVADWLADTQDIRFDRGMPGDGVADLAHIRRVVEATGYDGAIEVEIFSQRNWWQRDADEVLSVIAQRWRDGCF